MRRASSDRRPLFEPWLNWEQLPEATRHHALDILTALYLETVSLPPNLELQEDDATEH
jgi:hypothetical protein